MNNLLRNFFLILTLYPSSGALAMIVNHDEDDLKLSKKTPIISGISYEELNKNDKKGVITLCFKKTQKENEHGHASLVFEMLLPEKQNEISLSRIHYEESEGECLPGKGKVKIDSTENTLIRIYRGKSSNNTHVPAEHERYASWIISNDKLMEGYKQAEKDTEKNDSYTCVKYVSKIMRIVGLEGVSFWGWRRNTQNLKTLVDQYIKPKPDRTQASFPIIKVQN
jgi:hypothetical protein